MTYYSTWRNTVSGSFNNQLLLHWRNTANVQNNKNDFVKYCTTEIKQSMFCTWHCTQIVVSISWLSVLLETICISWWYWVRSWNNYLCCRLQGSVLCYFCIYINDVSNIGSDCNVRLFCWWYKCFFLYLGKPCLMYFWNPTLLQQS